MTGLARHFDAPFDAAQDILYVFARVTGVFDCIVPNWFINFKYVWLGFDEKKLTTEKLEKTGFLLGGNHEIRSMTK